MWNFLHIKLKLTQRKVKIYKVYTTIKANENIYKTIIVICGVTESVCKLLCNDKEMVGILFEEMSSIMHTVILYS